ncbi:hypothetical protein D3C80_1575380 [compost metagenome]
MSESPGAQFVRVKYLAGVPSTSSLSRPIFSVPAAKVLPVFCTELVKIAKDPPAIKVAPSAVVAIAIAIVFLRLAIVICLLLVSMHGEYNGIFIESSLTA